jgi:hypothetical protein
MLYSIKIGYTLHIGCLSCLCIFTYKASFSGNPENAKENRSGVAECSQGSLCLGLFLPTPALVSCTSSGNCSFPSRQAGMMVELWGWWSGSSSSASLEL